MDSGFKTFAAVFLLLAAASCAPTGHIPKDACGDVRSSSLQLHRVARTVAKEARNGSKDITDFSTTLLWIEAQDMCGPENLKQEPARCLGKMLIVLQSYISGVEKVAGFPSCSESVRKVKPVMKKLNDDVQNCLSAKLGRNHPEVPLDKHQKLQTNEEETDPIPVWQEDLLCHYTMDRLYSFSILSARVFAVGDPAHHTGGSAQNCM